MNLLVFVGVPFVLFFFGIYFWQRILKVPRWAQTIPTAPATFFTQLLGNMHLLDSPTGAMEKVTLFSRKLGPVWRLSAGPLAPVLVVITDPEGAAEVMKERNKGKLLQFLNINGKDNLLLSDGEFWHKERLLLNPFFSYGAVKTLYDIIAEEAVICCSVIRESLDTVVDADALMSRLALDIIGRVVFNQKLHSQQNPQVRIIQAVQALLAIQQECFMSPLKLLQVKLFGSSEFKAARNMINEVTSEGLKQLSSSSTSARVDMLPVLIRGSDDHHLSTEQILEEVQLFVSAGHETSAHSMSWALYHLSNNPSAKAKLVAELDKVLGQRVVPSLEDLRNLTYLSWVINETLRLTPVVPNGSIRVLSRDLTVCGHYIPSGTTCWVPFYPIFRDPLLWKNPEAFIPERWEESTHAQKYFPFSTGPRNCIGIAMAQQELKIALATIVKSFDFRLQEGAQVVAVQHITLKPRDGLPLIFSERKSK